MGIEWWSEEEIDLLEEWIKENSGAELSVFSPIAEGGSGGRCRREIIGG